jgi:hypothetical protein
MKEELLLDLRYMQTRFATVSHIHAQVLTMGSAVPWDVHGGSGCC